MRNRIRVVLLMAASLLPGIVLGDMEATVLQDLQESDSELTYLAFSTLPLTS